MTSYILISVKPLESIYENLYSPSLVVINEQHKYTI